MFGFDPYIRGWLALLLALGVSPAFGQRVEFPTTVPGPVNTSPPPSTGGTPVPLYNSPAPPTSGPAASFQGNITPPPSWDPYASNTGSPLGGNPALGGAQPNYYQQPPVLFPNGSPTPFASGGQVYSRPDGSVGGYQRLIKGIRFEYEWLNSNGGASKFGMNSAEISATTQWAFFYQRAPLEITPGFAAHWLDGPVTPADLPARLYDAYIDVGWKPQVTEWFMADVGVRVGAYTDFSHFSIDSIRYMGRGLGILSFSPTLQFVLGVVYVDRRKIKLLPAGGLIWTPNENMRWEILFPRPKLAQRLTTIGTTEYWWYVAGEYGGDSWTAARPVVGNDAFDYNDIRVIGGIEWHRHSGWKGAIEAAYVFNRTFNFDSGVGNSVTPSDTVMLRAAIGY